MNTMTAEPSPGAASSPPADRAHEGDELSAAFAELRASIDRAEAALRAGPAYGDDAERARAYSFLTRSIIQGLEASFLQDPDYPYFRELDFWLRGGGDNPDQRYAFAPIRGGEAYRVWGRMGSARRLELQLYAGQPWAGSGRSAGYLPFEEIEVAADGSFEIVLSATRPDSGGTWLENPADTTTLFVRQIYDEWDERPTGEVHLDRMGLEGARKPLDTPEAVAARLRASAGDIERRVTVWPAFVDRRYVKSGPANRVSPLIDTYKLGGVRGRWMAGGHFDLESGQALVIRTWPTDATIQSVQLADLVFDSLEYGNAVSSLNNTQVEAAPDGAYYHVVAAEDPGHPNWLDTGGLTRGVFMLRFDGVGAEIPATLSPSAELIPIADLPARVPGYRRVEEAERERVRAARRRHLQLRSGR